MDETTFVNEFCNQLAVFDKGIQRMRSWYLFSDKRSGSIQERFDLDAARWTQYQKLWGKQ